MIIHFEKQTSKFGSIAMGILVRYMDDARNAMRIDAMLREQAETGAPTDLRP